MREIKGLVLTLIFTLFLSTNGFSAEKAFADDDAQKTLVNELELVFVLDTTGSMGGLLEAAKTKIWSIVNGVMSDGKKTNVKVGLVAYRDRNDEYVTKVLPLTEDLDAVYSTLMEYKASGGGDQPEDVRRALSEGVDKAGWSKPGKGKRQIIFLVGDAPPHTDYVQLPSVLESAAKAVRKEMIVNTIQCGRIPGTKEIWQSIANEGEGRYFAIAQDGGVKAIESPYDKELSELGRKLGGTFVAYGGGDGEAGVAFRRKKKETQDNTELEVLASAPGVAQADRAVNKALNSNAYQDDLLQAIENKSIKLSEVKNEDLPEDLQKLSKTELKAEIEKRLKERKQIRLRIIELSKKRDEFVRAKRRKSGKSDGFDEAVNSALREQINMNQ